MLKTDDWSSFIKDGILSDKVSPVVERGWKRCKNLGVNPSQGKHSELPDKDHLYKLLDKNHALIKTAIPFMDNLYSFLQGSASVVSLTDCQGNILRVIGDREVVEQARAYLNLIEGVQWSEARVGNTAITTCLVEKNSVQISGPEHYCKDHHIWACSAAPIKDPKGSLIGVLNISQKAPESHPHTLGMAMSAAYAIEKAVAIELSQMEIRNQQKFQSAIIESMSDGMLSIDAKGIVTYLNAIGAKILGVIKEEVIGKHIQDIVDFKPVILSVLETGKGYIDKEFFITTRKGNTHHFIKSAIPIKDEKNTITGVVDIFREIKRVRKMVTQMVGAQANFTFHHIIGGKALEEPIRLAEIAAKSCSNVLIQGESGTGKEMFAQSIHNASDRAEGPFVAVNCAAIPRELLESELFGYESGAFTGASKGGRLGKFELANGGTLFLDEIGDMPLEMQVKLLRVLQERAISRLGSSNEINLDVRIIAATNKDLSLEVDENNFRRDLFYRLNVLYIHIPPLRDRIEDIDTLTQCLIKKLSARIGKYITGISPGVLEVFKSYPWPGNIRELENVIERAVNVAQNPEIQIMDMPRYLRDQEIKAEIKQSNNNILSISDFEKISIEETLRSLQGNISLSAKALKISRNTLYNKIRKYNIQF